MSTVKLFVSDIEAANDRDNSFFLNGYAYGQRAGAEHIIRKLQTTINDENKMNDPHEIKMLIYNLFKDICIESNYYDIQTTPYNLTDEP